MICILEKEDYIFLNSLIRISASIAKIYQNLFQLEINGKRNSSEYKKYFDYLTIAKEVEKRIYDENDMNAIKCAEFLKYLLSQRMMDNISDDQSIIKLNYADGKVRRVYNIISKRMIEDTRGMISLLNEANESGFTIPDKLIEVDYKKKVVLEILEKEKNLMFLSILFKSIPDNLLKKEKELINIKYFISFINPDVEQGLIYTNFKISDKVHLFSNLQANCYGLDLEEYSILRNIYGYSNSLLQINQLLAIDDLHYLDNKAQYQSFIYSSLLRSYLSFLSDLSLLELNKKFNELLNSKAKDRIKHYVSERIIKKSFYNINSDRGNQIALKLVK